VTIEDWSFTHDWLVCIRPQGDPDCYWTRREELKTPAEWKTWKAQQDAEEEEYRKESKRIHDMRPSTS
jgi:hypothetical protein